MTDKELKEWEQEAKEADISVNFIIKLSLISAIIGTFLYACEIYG